MQQCWIFKYVANKSLVQRTFSHKWFGLLSSWDSCSFTCAVRMLRGKEIALFLQVLSGHFLSGWRHHNDRSITCCWRHLVEHPSSWVQQLCHDLLVMASTTAINDKRWIAQLIVDLHFSVDHFSESNLLGWRKTIRSVEICEARIQKSTDSDSNAGFKLWVQCQKWRIGSVQLLIARSGNLIETWSSSTSWKATACYNLESMTNVATISVRPWHGSMRAFTLFSHSIVHYEHKTEHARVQAHVLLKWQ